MERRFLANSSPESIQIEERDGKRQLIGYASVFYDASEPGTQYRLYDRIYERIMPTAFDKVLADNPNTMALFNHDPNLVLGRTTAGTLSLSVFKKGLRYIVNPPDTTAANDVMTLIKRGDVTGASFAFGVSSSGQRWHKEGDNDIREIHSVDYLADVSVVTYPAYSAATAALRECDFVEARSAHSAWREDLERELSERDKEIAELQRRALRARAECVS